MRNRKLLTNQYEKHRRCFSFRRDPPEALDAAGPSNFTGYNIVKRIRLLWRNHPTECLAALFILAFRFVWYKNVQIAQLSPDSYSYINPGFQILSNSRTPVYPYIINILRILAGKHYLVGVVILQIAVSMVSLIFLYKLLFLATKNRSLSLFATAIYGASPTVIQWDTHILTESLSISGMVFFLYLIVSYIFKPSMLYGTGAIISAFILTMHRPSCMLINYALFVFWLLRLYYRDERSILKWMLLLSLIVIAVIQLYSYFVFQKFGDFALTPMTPRHLLAACLRSGVYQNASDKELVQAIHSIYEQNSRSLGYDTTTPVMALFGDSDRIFNPAVKEFCLDCIQRNPKQYIASIFHTMENHINASLYIQRSTMAYEHPLFKTCVSVQILLCTFLKIGHLYFLCFVEGITTLWIYIRSRVLDWIHLGLAVFLTMMVLFTFVGSYAAFSRLLIHTAPLAVLSITLLLHHIITALRPEAAVSGQP